MIEPIDVVIDTDIGADPDDAIAIALAIASPELNVRGVTIVSGHAEWRAQIANRVLGMLGRPDVPVIRDSSEAGMLGIEGRGVLDLEYSGPEATDREGDVAAWLIEESRRKPYHLVAIGPLTNVAAAISRDPGFATRLVGISVMGGVYDTSTLPDPIRQDMSVHGESIAWPDYNTTCDPEAALIVAESGAIVAWTTINITFTVPLSRAALGQLPPEHPFTEALRGMIGSWDSYRAESGTSIHGDVSPVEYTDTFLHDPLTIASLWHGDWLTMTPTSLRYEIVDNTFRMYPVEGGDPNANVSTNIEGETFADLCMLRIAEYMGRQRGQ